MFLKTLHGVAWVFTPQAGRSNRGEVTFVWLAFGPPPYVWRHRRRTGLFVLDLGRGRSARADNRHRKVKNAVWIYPMVTLTCHAPAYNPVISIKCSHLSPLAYCTRCQSSLWQAEHGLCRPRTGAGTRVCALCFSARTVCCVFSVVLVVLRSFSRLPLLHIASVHVTRRAVWC